MYIMLVDDEQWIVTGLSRILAGAYPHFLIDSFTNPEEALGAMQCQMPDLLITDIRMPEMEGLELIARARDLGLKFYAVLTGLDDFSLVQQSIRLKVADYLIKPVNKGELFALVDGVEKQKNTLAKQNQQSLSTALRMLVMYDTPWQESALDAAVAQYKTALLLVLEQPDASLLDALGLFFDEKIELWRFGQACYLFLSREQYVSVEESTEALCHNPSIESWVLESFQPAGIHARFADMMQRDAGHLRNAVAFFCAAPPQYTQVVSCLLKHVCATPQQNAPERLDAFWSAVDCKVPFWHTVKIAAACITKALDEGALAEVLSALPKAPMVRSQDVRYVLRWLEEKYTKPLTLAEAAAKVCLQANYFTTLFKKETGESFIQYLNQLRIDQACRMIYKTPNTSFEQQAADCGFTSTRYFFSTFKRFTDLTPGEFRQSLQQAGFYQR